MQFEHIKKWTRPESYMGPSYHGYYCGPGMHRDSDALARSNFKVALELLGGESACEDACDDGHTCAVLVVRDSHWAVGWIEYILVHESATDKLAILDGIYSKLEDYPVLNDEDFSETEMDEANGTFDNCISDFRSQVLEYLDFKQLKHIGLTRVNRLAVLDEFCSAVYHEAVGYEGLENAYVDKEAIKRLVESEYPPYDSITDNLFYKLCKVA